MTWDAAQKYCEDHKMNLPSFDTKAEASHFLGITTGYVWVGFKDTARNGKFRRVTDGKDITGILTWYPNNPSGGEYCGETIHYLVRGYNDCSCSEKRSLSCEFVET
jgi:Lectin C-type domain